MSLAAILIDTWTTERLKTLSVWSHVPEEHLEFRLAPRARTPHEHMVHQCVSEDTWMTKMLGLNTGLPALPAEESRSAFLRHYAEASERRLELLRGCSAEWFEEAARFFDTDRSRGWILVRRIAHTSHHRGQMTMILRALGVSLYSTYGPTADTGGLFQHGAPVIYRYPGVDELLDAETEGHPSALPSLPTAGDQPLTERPSGVS